MRGPITRTHVALEAAHRRSIAARERANDAPVSNHGSVFHWPWAQNLALEHTKALEMLPPCPTLSHEKRMSPKSGSPTRPCTCATEFRLRRGPGQRRKKRTACTAGCTVGKRAQSPVRRRSSLSPTAASNRLTVTGRPTHPGVDTPPHSSPQELTTRTALSGSPHPLFCPSRTKEGAVQVPAILFSMELTNLRSRAVRTPREDRQAYQNESRFAG